MIFGIFFLSLKIPPNFLCTPLYFYSLFLCFFLLYFCTFFPCFFSENSHWFLFLLPIFPLILFIFIFATTAENLLIKTSAIWKSLVVSLGIQENFFRKCLEKTADRVECAKCRQIKYWSCNNLYPAKWQFLDHFCILFTYLSFSKRQVKYLQSINYQKIFEIFFLIWIIASKHLQLYQFCSFDFSARITYFYKKNLLATLAIF